MAAPTSMGSSSLFTQHDGTESLQALLLQRSRARPCRSLLFYPAGNVTDPIQVSYYDLYQHARRNSAFIRQLKPFKRRSPILLHLDDQIDAILWFWAVMLAGGLPVMSTPFSSIPQDRNRHIQRLSDLLESPICITRIRDMHLFDGAHKLHLQTVESLLSGGEDTQVLKGTANLGKSDGHQAQDDDVHVTYEGGNTLAMLMLTSGSTGDAKAVCISHQQVFASVRGNTKIRPLPAGHGFLDWIGLDHVASLVEMHIAAMFLDIDLVHVHASNVVHSPQTFLDLLSRHRICRCFAPNFLLARLAKVEFDERWHLTALTLLTSGGEASDVSVCVAASALLERCGAVRNVIAPGFGMTETCAGSIHNLEGPNSDLRNGYDFACVGKCMDGIELRVTKTSERGVVELCVPNEPGNLELRGEVVFGGYYRQPEANLEAFTSDGWFRSEDRGFIDDDGNLCLIGRAKDVININGVKIAASDVQSSVERAVGSLVSRVICFPSRAQHTERVTVAYAPLEWPMNDEQMIQLEDLITRACFVSSGSSPVVFALGKDSIRLLPTSTLGKISRSKMATLFQAGQFTEDMSLHEQELKKIREKQRARIQAGQGKSTTDREERLIHEISEGLGIPSWRITADTNIFELGITSLDLVRLRHWLERRLCVELPVTTIMNHTSASALASVLYATDSPAPTYDPVVVLKSGGSKTPLWLVHPGVGEVLVFVGLAQQLRHDDRPIYALRPRGFEGQEPFRSIEEAVYAYITAIQLRQPQGPYALAGYSYGTMLAFEIAKRLDAPVRFLGNFNLPPHIKTRIRQLNWNICLLHLCYFTGLVSEEYTNDLDERSDFQALPRADAFRQVLKASNTDRLKELGLSEEDLMQWARVAHNLQSLAIDYEPGGMVHVMDVFHAVPLRMAARSREEWVSEHLAKWQDFCETRPRFHEVGGSHYTMLGQDHVLGFSVKLRAALTARGV
ncbi:acetyl-CoA synthetase-like protein [Xylaria grammica]|nr:acetyl-CoA synthetase-like protein [Xylaria grammica]